VAVGGYTVNVKVDDGKGGTASCAADIKVEQDRIGRRPLRFRSNAVPFFPVSAPA